MLIETELDTSAISEVALGAFSQNEKDTASDFISHHGIKGQKWGQRRYQNSDGSLTAEGRKRYGVGPALKNAGSAAGRAIGKAVRKATGRQTDAELDAELAKARKVHERKMKVDEINDLTGKKKKLSKMTDQEVDQYINRLSKERTVRQAEKDLKRMNRSDFSNFMSDIGGAVGAGVVEGVKRGVGYQVQKSFEKASDRRQSLKDANYKEKHKDKLSKEDLKSEADDSRNKLSAYRDSVELKALKGDKDAVRILSRVAEAKKGKASEGSDSSNGEKKEDSKTKVDPVKMYYDTKLTDMMRPKSGKSIDSYADQLIAQKAQEKADASRRNQAAYYERKEAASKALDSASRTKKKKNKKKK